MISLFELRVFLLAFLIGACTSDSNRGSSDSSNVEENDDTESSVYIPEGREDVDQGEGASVANDTTGAYLTVPEGTQEASISVNVSATDPVKDEDVKNWVLTMTIKEEHETAANENLAKVAIFYHVKKEDDKLYYGVIPAEADKLNGRKLSVNMVGLGNYQIGVLSAELTETKEIETTDSVFTKTDSDRRTSSIFADSSGRIFAGLERKFLYLSTDGSSYSQKNQDSGVGSLIVNGFSSDSSGNIYVATGRGVSVSTDSGSSFSTTLPTNGLGDYRVNAVHYGSDGNLYAGTDSGLSISSDQGKNFSSTLKDSGLKTNKINDVFLDSSGNLYAATDEGLSVRSSGATSFTTYTTSNGLKSNKVRAVIVDGNSRIWAATDGGLSLATVGSGSFTTYTKTNGLPTDALLDVYADANNRIYVASASGGVAYFDSTAGTAFATPTTKTVDDGLGSNIVLGIYADSSGTIYAATQLGIAILKTTDTKFTKKVFE